MPPACRFFSITGQCRHGTNCRFLHQRGGSPPSASPTPVASPKPAPICRFFSTNSCKKGVLCPFQHIASSTPNRVDSTPLAERVTTTHVIVAAATVCRDWANEGICRFENGCKFLSTHLPRNNGAALLSLLQNKHHDTLTRLAVDEKVSIQFRGFLANPAASVNPIASGSVRGSDTGMVVSITGISTALACAEVRVLLDKLRASIVSDYVPVRGFMHDLLHDVTSDVFSILQETRAQGITVQLPVAGTKDRSIKHKLASKTIASAATKLEVCRHWSSHAQCTSRPTCKFAHPNKAKARCKFGTLCTKRACRFRHTKPVTRGEKSDDSCDDDDSGSDGNDGNDGSDGPGRKKQLVLKTHRLCFRDNAGSFQPFSRSDARALRTSLRACSPATNIATIKSNNFVYSICLNTLRQTNMITGKSRRLRLVPATGTAAVTPTKAIVQSVGVVSPGKDGKLTLLGLATDLTTAKQRILDALKTAITTRNLSVDIPPSALVTLQQLVLPLGVDVVFNGQVLQLVGSKTHVNRAHARVQQHQSKLAHTQQFWLQQDRNCELVDVDKGSAEWKFVVKRVASTLKNRIASIKRVQNQRLCKNYCHELTNVREKLGAKPGKLTPGPPGGPASDFPPELVHARAIAGQLDTDANERLLFHGPKRTSPELIYNGEDGFDMRFSAAGMWGTGIYFAQNASYSHNYAHTGASGRQMFLALVICGASKTYANSDQSLRLPPLKKKKRHPDEVEFSTLRYDSVNANTNGSQVFVVYDNRKAYPLFLIEYE